MLNSVTNINENNITSLDERGKNSFHLSVRVKHLECNVQELAIITPQGPLCAAETVQLSTLPPKGSPLNQQVSEAKEKANPGSKPSLSNWKKISTPNRKLNLLHVSNCLTILVSNSPTLFFSQLKTAKKFAKLFSQLKTDRHLEIFSQLKSDPHFVANRIRCSARTPRRTVNTQERDSAGYTGLLNISKLIQTFHAHAKLVYPKKVVCQKWVVDMLTIKTSHLFYKRCVTPCKRSLRECG